MGNSNQKIAWKNNVHRTDSGTHQTYASQRRLVETLNTKSSTTPYLFISASNLVPMVLYLPNLENISGRSFASHVSQQSAYSVSRPWSRVSRRRWNATTLSDPLIAAKTAWPVPYVEAIFLPEFKIKGDITENSFMLIDLISKGAFGTVYKVQKRDSGEQYALKVLSKSLIISQNAVCQVKDEVRIQSMCGHHPFIVNSPFFWQNKKQLFIVSEYVQGGELLELCQKYGALPEELTRVYLAEIALAIDFLHNAGVIYRDLKLENILLDQENHIQIIDFGLAKWLKYGARTSTICGTIQYMAPEVLSMEPYSHAVDWWSLGIVMCCMLCGQFPASDPQEGAAGGGLRASPAPLLPPAAAAALTPPARALLARLLEPAPAARLRSLHALRDSAFFHGFSLEDARARKPKEILRKSFPEGPKFLLMNDEESNFPDISEMISSLSQF